ncbi:DUF4831 family protein [Microbacter margulisiae]|uniref:DUF4831 family protein n=1 Tax=Microbacter margulisiae TaxID=1350067 RepID=A0A7W5H1Q3_9PORP|nr:DUF4831 family protein [Microbacter margulisiae]MBB3187848.1 hypothetical protein [Microbacter margulisiae]
MKSFLLSALLCSAFLVSTQAQVVNSRERVPFSNGITYSLPKTVIVVQVQAVKTIKLVGPYFQYTERYLGTRDVITKNSITWSVQNVKVSTKAVPDAQNTYVIKPDPASSLSYVSLTPSGLLCGLNVPPVTETSQPEMVQPKPETPNLEFNNLILTEDLLQANSIARMAEVAAKQIYNIRDSRINLITGNMDKMPDGRAVNLMLQKMDKSENDLMELFVGKTVTVPTTVTFEIIPSQEVQNEVLFRLSTEDGIVGRNDLSGQPYYLTVKDATTKSNAGMDRGGDNGLYYRLPGQAVVTLSDPTGNVISRQTIILAQFGTIESLPANLFNKNALKIRIDPSTGALLSIEK